MPSTALSLALSIGTSLLSSYRALYRALSILLSKSMIGQLSEEERKAFLEGETAKTPAFSINSGSTGEYPGGES